MYRYVPARTFAQPSREIKISLQHRICGRKPNKSRHWQCCSTATASRYPARFTVLISVLAFFTAHAVASAQSDAPIVTMPATNGDIEAVLPISDEVAAIVVDPVEAVIAHIDTTTNGRYVELVDLWETTKATSAPAWNARKTVKRLRKLHIYAARTDIEPAIQQAPAWRINGAQPEQMTAVPVGIDDGRTIGAGDVDWRWIVYLVRSQQQAAAADGRWDVEFKSPYLSGRAQWQQNVSVSRAIRVNQVGYLRDSGKFAYFGAYMWGLPQRLTLPRAASSSALPFTINHAGTGAPVWQGRGAVAQTDASIARRMHAEEPLWLLDFSAWQPGGNDWYYIDIPTVGRSWPFRAGDGDFVFGEAFYTAARGLYHQRCGQALTSQFTPWTRGVDPGHARVYETDFIRSGYGPDALEKPRPWNAIRFDIIGATLDTRRVTYNVIGDWHDAADWDRSVLHYKVIYDFLYAFELAPHKFSDGQLNIPESGNGIPDVIDEAVWGLQPWIRSMDRKGGVSGMIETRTHHPFQDPGTKYGFARRERWSSLALCAAAAQTARLIETHGGRWGGNAASIAQELRSIALQTWSYGSDPANDLGTVSVTARKNRGTGAAYKATFTQRPEQLNMYMIHAASQMILLFGNNRVLNGIDNLIKNTPSPGKPSDIKNHHLWTAYHIAKGDVPSNLRAFVRRSWYANPADNLVAHLDDNGYLASIKGGATSLTWGNGSLLNQAEFLLAAHSLLGKEDYREAALRNVEHAFGANPMGMSWTTGIGWTYPAVLQHGLSDSDQIPDPYPGITIYGPTGGNFYSELKRDVWSVRNASTGKVVPLWTPPANIPAWRTWSPHPSLYVPANEFTVHQTMGSPAFVLGQLLDGRWSPDAALRNRGPRPENDLFGRLFLP